MSITVVPLNYPVVGWSLILGAVILVGTLVVGGAVMLFTLLCRPVKPPKSSPLPPRPTAG